MNTLVLLSCFFLTLTRCSTIQYMYLFFIAYVTAIESEIPYYEDEAKHYAKAGDMHKAQVMLTKKKLVEKEVLRTRITLVYTQG